MITAEELLNKNHFGIVLDIKGTGLYPEDITTAMKEFAKLHVEAALKEAQYKSDEKELSSMEVNDYYRNKILKAYPLTNIK